ncbi:two-component system, OmpR family, sensor histidine kinase ResE [Thermoflexales bacterium]|nr:two-component system, OmpR family, sensor histidine kinase ResE [Thermoflexales bacterium]
MSLRTRLLLSYALVILVCVAIIFVALLFLLREAPTQKRLVTGRLSLEAGVIQRLTHTALQNNVPPAQLIRRLANLDNRTDTRILLINVQSGEVLGDTGETLTGHNLFKAGRPVRFNNTLNGEFDAEGEHWLYSTGPLLNRRDQIEVVAAVSYEITSPLRDPIFRELMQPLGIALVIASAVSIALATLVTRSVTRPLQHVAQAAQKITAGDYSQTVPVEGPSEFKEVALNFNQMSQKVRDTQQSQRDFLANVTHELKTPLTSIQGFAQAIQDGAVREPEAVRKSAAIIHDEATRMNRLVMELLELARIESGQIVMRREAVKLDLVLHSVIERLALRAQTSGVELQTEIAADLPALVGDGDRLAQILSNLIDNALKHTPSGGKVVVAARSLSGSAAVKRGMLRAIGGVEISVADTGPGIPAEDLSRIFERFYQVEKSRARSKEGSLGLGLAIVKEIVAAHGGTIHAESIVGLGTKFVVWLPSERTKA